MPVPVVWVVDETGFVKKGTRSAGVQRQCTGTTGKIDNPPRAGGAPSQVGVFLAVITARGRALVDAELYLPVAWTDDADRCAAAAIPGGTEFATKPELGTVMLGRALTAGHLRVGDWVAADEAYGQNRTFRTWLGDHAVPFSLATRSDDRLPTADGARRRATALAAMVPESAWEERSAGAGADGHRYYAWARVDLDPAGLPDGWGHQMLVRRQIDPPAGKAPELAFCRCAGPATTTITTLVRVAGARWGIEESFQTAKNEAGLDHYQARTWRAWYTHTTLSMLAAAYLAVTRAGEHEADPSTAQPADLRGQLQEGARWWRRGPDPADQQRDPPLARRPRLSPGGAVR